MANKTANDLDNPNEHEDKRERSSYSHNFSQLIVAFRMENNIWAAAAAYVYIQCSLNTKKPENPEDGGKNNFTEKKCWKFK